MMATRKWPVSSEILVLLLALVFMLAGCGGSNSSGSGTTPGTTNMPTLEHVAPISGIGVGGSSIYQPDRSTTDLYLQWNAAGASVALSVKCSGCRMSAQGKTAGAGEVLPVRFSAPLMLDGSTDIPVVIKDANRNRIKYTLHAVPPDYPSYQVTGLPETSAGDVYLTANYLSAGTDSSLPAAVAYAIKLSNHGQLLFYARDENEADTRFYDFKKTVLSDGRERYSFSDFTKKMLIVMDESMRVIDQVAAQPATDGVLYPMDIHDSQILDDGHYLIGLFASKTVTNIPGLGGASAKISATGLQEINQGHVAFNWLSSDHPQLYACAAIQNNYGASEPQDYAHWNSLAVDTDGNLIASFRHFSAVLKISRADNSGAIRWILGGPCDQFHLTTAQQMAFQHDARRVPDGSLSIFDDHSDIKGSTANASRAARYWLDEADKTVLAFQSDSVDQAHFSWAMGNAQYLPTGELFIGWGAHIDGKEDVTEWNPTLNEKTFQLTFNNQEDRVLASYRAQKK
jgi:arylsulfate sulfotransferase